MKIVLNAEAHYVMLYLSAKAQNLGAYIFVALIWIEADGRIR
jgi:hypothetical protein